MQGFGLAHENSLFGLTIATDSACIGKPHHTLLRDALFLMVVWIIIARVLAQAQCRQHIWSISLIIHGHESVLYIG